LNLAIALRNQPKNIRVAAGWPKEKPINRLVPGRRRLLTDDQEKELVRVYLIMRICCMPTGPALLDLVWGWGHQSGDRVLLRIVYRKIKEFR